MANDGLKDELLDILARLKKVWASTRVWVALALLAVVSAALVVCTNPVPTRIAALGAGILTVAKSVLSTIGTARRGRCKEASPD